MFLSRTALWEARVADLKEAHQREVKALRLTIDALAEQVEYLRAQQDSKPFISRTVVGHNPSELELVGPGDLSYMTEEEEDIRALRESGQITELAMEQALAQAGLRNTHVQIDQT